MLIISKMSYIVTIPLQILFARAEALHAHGHTKDACRLAKQLAEEMLANPPDLASDQSTIVSIGKGHCHLILGVKSQI